MKNKTKDSQFRAVQLTINNPVQKDMNHSKIIDNAKTLSSLDYICLCDEIGENKTPHTHVYMHFKSPVRFSRIKNLFAVAHIEPAQGTAKDNRDYIRKEGKWKDSEKEHTNLKNTFEEYGTMPVSSQGKRNDLVLLYDMIRQGKSNIEILEDVPDIGIRYFDKINKIRLELQIDTYKNNRRVNLKTNYISGDTGTGKSRYILDTYGDSNCYRVTDYCHPFDNYSGQSVLIFEEYRSSLKLSDMLNYLDIYPLLLPARYNQKWAMYTTVFIVSNWTFEQQYSELQNIPEQKSSYEAFKRRINGYVKIFHKSDIDTYDTLKLYLERNNKTNFIKLTDFEQAELPFK